MATLYIDQLINNPNAKILINPGNAAFFVEAFITEDFGFGGANSYNNPFEMLLNSKLGQAAGSARDAIQGGYNAMAAAAGAAGAQLPGRSITAGESLSSWIGSERPKFDLNVLFVARNPGDNPITQHKKLMRYLYGDLEFGAGIIGIMRAPLDYSPAGVGASNVQGCVAVSIGLWFQTPRVFLMKAGQSKISQRTDPQGNPLYVQAQLSFEAYRPMSYDEVADMFPTG